MLELAGPLAVAALVLAAGGVYKLADPAPTREMLVAVGLQPSRMLTGAALLSGAVELALGVATFMIGGRVLAGLTALAFVIFTLLAVRLVRAPAATSCGCFGRHSGRATWLHVAVDGLVAVLAMAAAIADAPGLIEAGRELPAAGVPFAGFAMLGAWFVVVTLTVLPAAMLAARRGPAEPDVAMFTIRSAP